MKKIWNGVTTILLLAMIAIAAIIYVPKLVGIEPLIVLSGSMEPTYHVGSLLYVKPIDAGEAQVGDPITFQMGDNLVTHRVIDIDTVNQTYTTQGDANNVADGTPVAFDKVIGTPILSIPKLGYFADKLGSVTGKIIYITVIVVVLILMYLGDVIWSIPGENTTEEKNDEEK